MANSRVDQLALSLLCIAAPVSMLPPVDATVAQHEAVQVEASIQDGSGGT